VLACHDDEQVRVDKHGLLLRPLRLVSQASAAGERATSSAIA
jgi:hypothetical protein